VGAISGGEEAYTVEWIGLILPHYDTTGDLEALLCMMLAAYTYEPLGRVG
jgi:hypothetical protein